MRKSNTFNFINNLNESLTTENKKIKLNKSLKKKINESENTDIPDITYIFEDYDWKFNITTKEDLGLDYSYHKLVKTAEEAEKFNYHSDYWGSADTYQEEVTEVVSQFEPYIDKKVLIDTDDGPITCKLLGVLIDKQYNSVGHLEILVEDINKSNLEESEQQLNEETVGEKITSPSGKFYVGDPCYVLSDDIYYGIWDDKYNFEDGIINCKDNLSFLAHGTAYGDGLYTGTNGFDYGVDSGTLGIVPIELVEDESGLQFGTIETSKTAWLDYNDGIFDITLDNKSFSIITKEEDYEEDEYYEEDDYNDEDDLDESEETKELYVYSDANSHEKEEVEGNVYNYRQEAPELTFKIHKDGDMYFVDFIGSKEDIENYLKKLGWYTDEELKNLELIKKLN